MAERLKALDSKSSVRVTVPGVRIPLSPPVQLITSIHGPHGSRCDEPGEVTEWPKVHDWKSCVGLPTEGSNPSLSANRSVCVPGHHRSAYRSSVYVSLLLSGLPGRQVDVIGSTVYGRWPGEEFDVNPPGPGGSNGSVGLLCRALASPFFMRPAVVLPWSWGCVKIRRCVSPGARVPAARRISRLVLVHDLC